MYQWYTIESYKQKIFLDFNFLNKLLVVYSLKGKTTEECIAEVTEGVKDVVGDVVGALVIMNQPQEGKTFLIEVA